MKPEFAKKLLRVQEQLGKVSKDGDNPFFHSKYVTLDNVLETVLPTLNDNGLVLYQMVSHDDGIPVLKTAIIDVNSGEDIKDKMLLMMSKQDSQGQGSAITYARRYAIMAMLSLQTGDDDDGNASSSPPDDKTMPGDKMAKVIEELKAKGIQSKGDAIKIIRIISGDQPLNTSAVNRLIREIENTGADTLKEMLLMEGEL